ncbi:MAG: transcriptional regulator [Spirochaetaceae bacterium 4572_7]|nr:MAG: transcriptional regulator [Spirochaetaceae bacterium 4572_7]
MSFNILIVDDEKNIRDGLSISLEMDGYNTYTAEDGLKALDFLVKERVDLVISDLKMPKMPGGELLKKITATYPTIPVIMLTGHGTVENAVVAMRDGAYDFLTKPVNLDHLTILVKRALGKKELIKEHKKLKKEVEELEKKTKVSKLIGKSSAMSKLSDLINQVADSKASVIITGESGVGKEVVANALHSISSRSKEPLINVHCAALSESLLESELFGHEKGAFTGATTTKKGRFELANNGTIFLDEIGEINPSTQVKLLRVLQERSFERVGGEIPISVDVRVITATNRDLLDEIKNGNFREDLYYRLNVVHIHIPPLRERKEDIPLLVSTFIAEFASDNGKNITNIDVKALRALTAYNWPGNIRELRNSIESAVVLSSSTVIGLNDLPQIIREGSEGASITIPVGITMAEAEKIIISETLRAENSNKSKTSEILGIGRKTLHRKIHDYGLEDEFLKKID